MLKCSPSAFEGNDLREVKDVEMAADDVDALHEAIKPYLIRAFEADMSQDDSGRHVETLTFTSNLEHIGDIIDKNLMELATKKTKKRYAFRRRAGPSYRPFAVVSSITCAWPSTCSPPETSCLPAGCSGKRPMRAAEVDTSDRHFARLKEGRA
jgi:phosphate:Na+ symporter